MSEQGHKEIYEFFERTKLGKSAVGSLMDAAAKGQHVMAHRLYGHHLIYDFPFTNLKNAPSFLFHELSDLFTSQGLPILPGEMLKSLKLLKACDKLQASDSWNLVNGFDLLAGTVAIYSGIHKCRSAFAEVYSLDTIPEIARELGIGVIELAFALSTCNPFLLLGATLTLTAGIRAVFTDSALFYFRMESNSLTISFSSNCYCMEKLSELYALERATEHYTIEASTSIALRDSAFRDLT